MMPPTIPGQRVIDGDLYVVRPCNGAPGWSVQRWYPDVERWFDVGDPADTIAEANEKLEALR